MNKLKIDLAVDVKFCCPPAILVYNDGSANKKVTPIRRSKTGFWLHHNGKPIDRHWNKKIDEAYTLFVERQIVEE